MSVFPVGNEQILATDHKYPNPIHEHSTGVSSNDPHAHNSQESVASIMLQNGQFLVAYENYHGDSSYEKVLANYSGLIGFRENNRDSIYYKIYNYNTNTQNLTLLNNFSNAYNSLPYSLSKSINYLGTDGNTKTETLNFEIVEFLNGLPVAQGQGTEKIIIGKDGNKSEGLLVNKNTYYNQRDPSVCTLGNNYYVIAIATAPILRRLELSPTKFPPLIRLRMILVP